MTISLARSRQQLRVDSTIEAPTQGLPLTARRAVTSAMGRFASAEQLSSYPELGGFEMLCITPARTAHNKLDALHRRAALGLYRGIVTRGRDLYDLYRIAQTEHGQQVIELIEASPSRAARTFPGRDEVPRPPDGYGTSSVFATGTEANAALESGFQLAVERLVWGEAPTFEEAVEAARSLDLA